MVIGYPVLAVLTLLALWFGVRIVRDVGKLLSEKRYERKLRKSEERKRASREESWVLEPHEDYDESSYSASYHDTDVYSQVPLQRHPTAELPQLTNYQEELRHERS